MFVEIGEYIFNLERIVYISFEKKGALIYFDGGVLPLLIIDMAHVRQLKYALKETTRLWQVGV